MLMSRCGRFLRRAAGLRRLSRMEQRGERIESSWRIFRWCAPSPADEWSLVCAHSPSVSSSSIKVRQPPRRENMHMKNWKEGKKKKKVGFISALKPCFPPPQVFNLFEQDWSLQRLLSHSLLLSLLFCRLKLLVWSWQTYLGSLSSTSFLGR